MLPTKDKHQTPTDRLKLYARAVTPLFLQNVWFYEQSICRVGEMIPYGVDMFTYMYMNTGPLGKNKVM